jgi:hypothetical protein
MARAKEPIRGALDGRRFCHWDRWLLRVALDEPEPEGLRSIARELERREPQLASPIQSPRPRASLSDRLSPFPIRSLSGLAEKAFVPFADEAQGAKIVGATGGFEPPRCYSLVPETSHRPTISALYAQHRYTKRRFPLHVPRLGVVTLRDFRRSGKSIAS